MWWIAVAWGCDTARVAEMVKALLPLEPQLIANVVHRGYAEACPSPPTVAAMGMAWRDLSSRDVAELSASREETGAIWDVCPKGQALLGQWESLPVADRRAAIYDRCNLARFGWADRSEWVAGTGWSILAMFAGQSLASSGVPADQARFVVRALAGIGLPPAASP